MFALPYLNDEIHIEQVTTIEDSLEIMAANDNGDVFADECTENNIEMICLTLIAKRG